MIKQKNTLNEKIVGNQVICDNCDWTWNISDGGDTPYTCHKCGNDNTPIKEDLRKWFKEKWVNIGKKVDGKHPPCGTSGEKSGYAKCVPSTKASSMSKKEKESATRRKRAAQNASNRGGSDSKGQGKTPIYVSTKPKNEEVTSNHKSTQSEAMNTKLKSLIREAIDEVKLEEKLNLFLENNCPTDSSKWSYYKSQAKKKFDVYPSAYANGWAAKQYKSAGGGWKQCTKEGIHPEILDISKENELNYKQSMQYDEPTFTDAEYYTGMQGKR